MARTLSQGLRSNAQQRACGVAQDCRPLGVAQTRRAENVIHGRARPRIRVVGPHHDLAGAAFRDQMPQRLGGEDQRVEIELWRPDLPRRLWDPMHRGPCRCVQPVRRVSHAQGMTSLRPRSSPPCAVYQSCAGAARSMCLRGLGQSWPLRRASRKAFISCARCTMTDCWW